MMVAKFQNNIFFQIVYLGSAFLEENLTIENLFTVLFISLYYITIICNRVCG